MKSHAALKEGLKKFCIFGISSSALTSFISALSKGTPHDKNIKILQQETIQSAQPSMHSIPWRME